MIEILDSRRGGGKGRRAGTNSPSSTESNRVASEGWGGKVMNEQPIGNLDRVPWETLVLMYFALSKTLTHMAVSREMYIKSKRVLLWLRDRDTWVNSWTLKHNSNWKNMEYNKTRITIYSTRSLLVQLKMKVNYVSENLHLFSCVLLNLK